MINILEEEKKNIQSEFTGNNQIHVNTQTQAGSLSDMMTQ